MTDEERQRAIARERERTGLDPGRPEVEELAARLDGMDEEGALRTALDVLARERDPEVLETALGGLMGLESVPVEPLLEFAERQRNPDLSIQALELLSEHGRSDPRVSDLLTKLARESKNAEVREAAQDLLEDLQTQYEPVVPRREGARAPPSPPRVPTEQPGPQPR
jgi:hypothetical protein